MIPPGHPLGFLARRVRTSSRHERVRSVAVTVATTILCGAFLMVGVAVAQYGGMEQREAARMVAQVTDPLAEADRVPSESFRYEPVTRILPDGRTATLILADGLRSSSPVPPGLAAWPRPGDAVASPAWMAAMADPTSGLAEAFGPVTVSAQISRAGLSDSQEIIAYQVLPEGVLMLGRPYEAVGFGGRMASMSGAAYRQPILSMLAIAGIGLVLPAGVVLAVACTVGSEVRARREEIFALVGAPRPAVLRLRARMIAPALSAGALAGLVQLGLLMTVDMELPGTGYVLTAADNAAQWPLLAAMLLAAFLVASIAAVAGATSRQRRVRPQASRPRALGRVKRARALAAPGVAALTVVTTNVVIATSRDGTDALVVIYLAGIALTLALLPWSAGAWIEAASALISKPGLQAGRPAMRIAAGQIGKRPRPTIRLAAGAAVGVALLCVGVRYVDLWRDDATAASEISAAADGRILSVAVPAIAGDRNGSTTVADHIREAADASGLLSIGVIGGTPLATASLYIGDDATFEAAGILVEGTTLVGTSTIGRLVMSVEGDPWLTPTRAPTTEARAPDSVIVVSPTGEPIDADRLNQELAGPFAPTLRASAIGASWDDGGRILVWQTRWLLAVGAAALAILAVALTIGFANESVRLVRALVPLLVVAPWIKAVGGVVAWRVWLPVVLAATVGAVAGLTLSLPLQSFNLGSIDLPWAAALWGFLGAAAIGAAAWAAITTVVLRDARRLRFGVREE